MHPCKGWAQPRVLYTPVCLHADHLQPLQGVCIPRFEAAGYRNNAREYMIATAYIPGAHPSGDEGDDPSVLAGALEASRLCKLGRFVCVWWGGGGGGHAGSRCRWRTWCALCGLAVWFLSKLQSLITGILCATRGLSVCVCCTARLGPHGVRVHTSLP